MIESTAALAPTMTIDGEPAAAQRTFAVRNPATGDVIGEAPDCSAEQLDRALRAADRAFAAWSLDESARRAMLGRAADVVDAHADDLAPLLTMEQGKPLRDARGEVGATAAWLRYYASLELPIEVIQDDERARVEVLRRPVGPVAAITPWNFPLMLSAWKLGPALAAGNTVVLKPSPYTPLATLRMGELLRDVLPPGVLSVVTGTDQLGAAMVSHPVTRKVTLTGSIATGKRVAAAAAADLKRVTLELGGNDAAIVLGDVDPNAIAEELFWAAFGNCGQVCSAVKRVYAHASIADELAEALAARARAVVVGDGMEPGTQMGPLNNEAQRARVAALVDEAIASEGRAVAGGRPIAGPGNFYEPTIIAGVQDGIGLVDEEQFGPALPVIAVADDGAALAAANAGMYGLGGSVWSADVERATALANRLQCGTVWINTHTTVSPAQPFGGARWSGIGVEGGPWGLNGFTEVRTRYTKRG